MNEVGKDEEVDEWRETAFVIFIRWKNCNLTVVIEIVNGKIKSCYRHEDREGNEMKDKHGVQEVWR